MMATSMPVARLLSRSHLAIALAYLSGYVLLDWVSYVHPFAAFGITPWNPSTGLSFALILLFGVEFLPWLFVAPLLADALVRGLALPLGPQLFAAAIIGSGIGFLWYNTYPAQVFMGDVGSLALGGGLGMLAVLTKNELLSVILGGIFVLEAVSVITQVVSFKMFGRRVFCAVRWCSRDW